MLTVQEIKQKIIINKTVKSSFDNWGLGRMSETIRQILKDHNAIKSILINGKMEDVVNGDYPIGVVDKGESTEHYDFGQNIDILKAKLIELKKTNKIRGRVMIEWIPKTYSNFVEAIKEMDQEELREQARKEYELARISEQEKLTF